MTVGHECSAAIGWHAGVAPRFMACNDGSACVEWEQGSLNRPLGN
jgi:hypothetical protein